MTFTTSNSRISLIEDSKSKNTEVIDELLDLNTKRVRVEKYDQARFKIQKLSRSEVDNHLEIPSSES